VTCRGIQRRSGLARSLVANSAPAASWSPAADIVIVDGDPSGDLAALPKITTVFRNGVCYESAELRRSAEGAIPAGRLRFRGVRESPPA